MYFFLNNQTETLIIQTVFCYKIPHVSGNLFALHQKFSTVHSVKASFVQVFDDHFQAESRCSILTLHGNGHQKPARNLPVSNIQ